MNHEQKLAFLQNMTHMALSHAASTPNVPTPTGGMSHDKMLSFVSGIASKGLKHLAEGGTTLDGPTTQVTNANTTAGGIGGGIGNVVGSNNQFQASAAPIQAGTNTAQLNQSYTGAQGALNNQGIVTGALTPGVNQGARTQANLSDIYMSQIQGNGPNPALTQLNQTTAQNIQNQAALAANQRGAGANAGLINRQVAQQGAATQQQAVGQAATLNAQQQLAAEQNLQNLSGNQISQGLGAVQGENNAQQNEQNILQGANTGFNNAQVGQQSNINNVNAAVSTANSNNAGGLFGDAAQGISAAAGFLFAEGGKVKRKPVKMAEGGGISGQPTSGPQSYVGQWLNSSTNSNGPQIAAPVNIDTSFHDPFAGKSIQGPSTTNEDPMAGTDEPFTNIAEPAADTSGIGAGLLGKLNPLDISNTGPIALAAGFAKGGMLKKGGKVPGKAKVDHDSLENDTVPAMLSPGEVVIDKDTLAEGGVVGQMARAVAAHIAKRNKKK